MYNVIFSQRTYREWRQRLWQFIALQVFHHRSFPLTHIVPNPSEHVKDFFLLFYTVLIICTVLYIHPCTNISYNIRIYFSSNIGQYWNDIEYYWDFSWRVNGTPKFLGSGFRMEHLWDFSWRYFWKKLKVLFRSTSGTDIAEGGITVLS